MLQTSPRASTDGKCGREGLALSAGVDLWETSAILEEEKVQKERGYQSVMTTHLVKSYSFHM